VSETPFERVVREALEHAWGKALDVSQSKDFRNDDGTLDEDAYEAARANVIDHLSRQIFDARPSR
jgi:hypothetical protein